MKQNLRHDVQLKLIDWKAETCDSVTRRKKIQSIGQNTKNDLDDGIARQDLEKAIVNMVNILS